MKLAAAGAGGRVKTGEVTPVDKCCGWPNLLDTIGLPVSAPVIGYDLEP